MLDWSSAASMLRMLTAYGAAAGAALAAAALALFFTLGRQRLTRTQVAGGVLGFALGAALFAPSIAEVQVPLQALATRWAMGHLATANTLVLSVPAVLLTGIVQEPAKFLAAGLGVWAVRRGRRRAAPAVGALAGAGYGGMEAAVILSYALAMVPSGTFPWLATVERASAVVFHLSLPGIVMFWWARGGARGILGLLGAVLAHAALDSLPVLLGMGLVGVACVEVVGGTASLALFAYLIFLVRGARRGEQND
ncbi:MAG: hypothetical protein ACM3ZU_02185 [Bacteroidota bacterium]